MPHKGKSPPPPHRSASPPVSWKDSILISFTFVTCCVGSGLLTIGKMFSTMGLAMSCILACIAFGYAIWSLVYLTKINYHGNFTSLRETSEKLYGKLLAVVSDVSVVFCNIGYLCSYISVSSDYIRDGIYQFGHVEVLNTDSWRKIFKVIVAFCVMLPLSLFRSLGFISSASSLCIVFSLVAVIAINVRFGQWIRTGLIGGVEHPKPKVPLFPEDSKGWIATVAYIPFLFCILTIHACITPIQHELDIKGGASARRKTTLMGVMIAVILTILLYGIVGIEATIMFDRSCTPEEEAQGCMQINSNILLNFGNDTPLAVIKLLYAVAVIVAFPCMLYPVRNSVCEWFKIDKYNGKKAHPELTRAERRKKLPKNISLGYLWYILSGLVIIIIDTILSVFVPDIDRILSIATNIFGVILFELLYVMYWHRGKLCKAYSIGKLLDVKFKDYVPQKKHKKSKKSKKENKNNDNTENKKDKENSETSVNNNDKKSNESSISHDSDDVSKTKKKSIFEKYKQIRKSSIGNIDTGRKLSLVLAHDHPSLLQKNGEPADITKLIMDNLDSATAGGRHWEEESSTNQGEELPRIGDDSSNISNNSSTKTNNSNSESKSSSSNKSVESRKDSINLDKTTQKKSLISTKRQSELIIKKGYESIIVDNTTNVIETNGTNEAVGEGQILVDVVFPDLSKEKNKVPRSKKVGFYILVVLFSALNLAATTCSIYNWVRYG